MVLQIIVYRGGLKNALSRADKRSNEGDSQRQLPKGWSYSRALSRNPRFKVQRRSLRALLHHAN